MGLFSRYPRWIGLSVSSVSTWVLVMRWWWWLFLRLRGVGENVQPFIPRLRFVVVVVVVFESGDYLAHTDSTLYARISQKWLSGLVIWSGHRGVLCFTLRLIPSLRLETAPTYASRAARSPLAPSHPLPHHLTLQRVLQVDSWSDHESGVKTTDISGFLDYACSHPAFGRFRGRWGEG